MDNFDETSIDSATTIGDKDIVAAFRKANSTSLNAIRKDMLMTSELRHFVDMVYLQASSRGLFPSYVNKEDFKVCVENIRRFDWDLVRTDGELECNTVREAYVYALIVYGFIKELAASGDNSAAAAYEALKQLIPFKI